MEKETMKAVICTKFGPPEVLKLKEVDKPTPKDEEVLIRNNGTSVNTSLFATTILSINRLLIDLL
jgi:D-arabinose 1-dehydrogenase-like Zn-dependent alcohol dehydrogenase